METIKSFEGGAVAWETFEDLHTSTSNFFEKLRYMVSAGIEMGEVTDDTMPYDIIEDLVIHH